MTLADDDFSDMPGVWNEKRPWQMRFIEECQGCGMIKYPGRRRL